MISVRAVHLHLSSSRAAACNQKLLAAIDGESTLGFTEVINMKMATLVLTVHIMYRPGRFRLDLAALAEGDVVSAQEAKTALEERQRCDAKVRKDAIASH
jgi:hypothetical protein